MSVKYLIANWKMQLSQDESVKQALSLSKLLAKSHVQEDVKMVVCPDFVSLSAVGEALAKSPIALGAQDGFYEEKGAFTSQVSMRELKNIGCEYVIIGHSERRQLGETDVQVNKKVAAALTHGLTPIICVGETFEERKEGQKDLVIMHQVYEALHNIKLSSKQKIIVAYEPVWVIGTGQAIGSADAFYAASLIQQSLLDSFPNQAEDSFTIIYGGSVNPRNINDFMGLPNISGALVGGASLVAEDFLEIIKKIK